METVQKFLAETSNQDSQEKLKLKEAAFDVATSHLMVYPEIG